MIKVINDPVITKNFKLSEFKCKCGCDTVIVDLTGIMLLQTIRNYFDKPVTIVSATRCKTHNTKVNGAPNSKHLEGIAYDIKVEGVHPEIVARFALQLGFNGIGVYTNNGNMFTHIDRRLAVTLWRDQAGSKELLKVTNSHIWR